MQIHAHRLKERGNDLALDAGGSRGDSKGVHDDVAAEARCHGGVGLSLEFVEHSLWLHGAAGHARVLGRAIHDFVGNSHQGIDIAHVSANLGRKQPSRKAKRGAVCRDNLGCCSLRGSRIKLESRWLLGGVLGHLEPVSLLETNIESARNQKNRDC